LSFFAGYLRLAMISHIISSIYHNIPILSHYIRGDLEKLFLSTSWVLPRLDRIHPLFILFSWGSCWCSSSYKWIYKQWEFQDLTMELLYHSHILWLYSLTPPFRVPKMNIDITIVRGIMNIANPNLWRLPP
jgi:hypothetical protein